MWAHFKPEQVYKSSSFYTHFVMDHDLLRSKLENLISNFEVIYSNPEIITSKIAEAVLIKHHKPILNIKYNELYDFLSLF